MRTTRHKVLATMLALMAGFAANAQADDAPQQNVNLNIAAQPLGNALTEFARQSGLQVLLFAEVSAGLKAPRIAGSYAPNEALKMLLASTDLHYEYVNARTIAIRSTKKTGDATTKKVSSLDTQSVITMAQADFAESMDAAEKSGKATVKGKNAGDDVEEMIVKEDRIKPFSDANADKPRTINDEQPYYVFDAKTIERSGATSVEDFLKSRLTMNTTALTNGEDPATGAGAFFGNTSSINLRGLGADKTLILVNGRRMAAPVYYTADYQTDLNGIPLSAIERIEVLPSSASGIYGGSAIGGVVNVVLKRDYSGGEVRLSYDNTWDTDAPIRKASATFGQSLEGGKTQFMITGQWSDADPLLFVDRRELADRGIKIAIQNAPGEFYSATLPFLGATPNISHSTGSATTLVLKDGRTLNSRNTYVLPGTAPGISLAALSDQLFANAGSWNLELPNSTQGVNGLLRPLSAIPTMKSVMTSVRRQMSSRVEAFLEMTYQNNGATTISNNMTNLSIPASAPTNPFNSAVRLRLPSRYSSQHQNESITSSITGGLQMRFPQDWVGQLEYGWSKNTFEYDYVTYDLTAVNADLASGVFNPFIDTLLYPPNQAKYASPRVYAGSSKQGNLALRGSGPLPSLPWGAPTLTFGVERRTAIAPENTYREIFPFTVMNNYVITNFERKQIADAVYTEISIPLVAKAAVPLVRGLDLQISGRSERYTADSGTPSYTLYPNDPSRSGYGSPTLNGQPFSVRTSYTSKNVTFGIKYQPIESVTLRTSVATAFMPPTAYDLTPNPAPYQTDLNDPSRGGALTTGVDIYYGGNPNVKPQNSRSWNAGLIWEPATEQLQGLRINTEYYRIQQFDRIGSLGAQTIVDAEQFYPGRVVRDAGGDIVSVDDSSMNLYKLSTEGWDFSVDYRRATPIGTFNLHAVQTYIMHEQRQQTLLLPLLDYAGFVGEGGPAKIKANLNATLERNHWMVGWATTYFGSYKQYGAAGGPYSVWFNNGTVFGTTVQMQGGETIPSQAYHTFIAGYSFGEPGREGRAASSWSQWMDGLNLQVGVKNVFNTMPPFDANYGASRSYLSPFGDKRLRSYWINVTKHF